MGDYLARHGQENKIIEAVSILEKRYPFPHPAQRTLYNRLLAFGYVSGHHFSEAEEYIQRGLREAPDAIDFYYALAYLKASMREYEEAAEASEKYLAQYDSAVTKPEQHFSATSRHRAQLLNFLATSYQNLMRTEAAVDTFEQSIAEDPGNHLPYLNLASLYVQKRNWAKAEAVVDRGLKSCRQIQELRMLLDTFRKKTTISACMIVKDEEEMLPGCLDSIRDWVDEIIVVDTGSTDRTVEIAASYGAKIYHQPWEANFSKHRNYSIEQATGEWVFIIDADERVYEEDVPQIVRLLNSGEHPFISVNVINVYGKNEEQTTFLPSERFFKRELNLRYKGIVHNQLDVPSDLRAARTGVRMKHYGYGLTPDKMKKKLARSKQLLEKQLSENPDNAFARFNLAQLLRAGDGSFPVENAPEIIKHATRAVELTDPSRNRERHIHVMALDQLAWTSFYTKDLKRAEEYSQRALAIKPGYLDPLLLMGHIRAQQQDYDAALVCYQDYIEAQAAYDPAREMDNIILMNVDARANVFYGMAMIYRVKGDEEKAREYYHKTIALRPDYQQANCHLGQLYLQKNKVDEAEKYFRRQLEQGEVSHDAAMGLAAIATQRNDPVQAEEYYRKALEINPHSDSARTRLGQLYAEQGQAEAATAHLEQACRANPADAALCRQLAEAYFRAEQYDRAAEAYQRLIDRGTADAEVLNDLGNCRFRQGRYGEAEDIYLRALQMPTVPEVTYRNLGLARARQGKTQEAIWSFERYLQTNPEETEIWQITGGLYVDSGDFESALSLYERYLSHYPDDLAALYQISECYLHMGHRDSALMGYRRILQVNPAFEAARERVNQLAEVVPQPYPG